MGNRAAVGLVGEAHRERQPAEPPNRIAQDFDQRTDCLAVYWGNGGWLGFSKRKKEPHDLRFEAGPRPEGSLRWGSIPHLDPKVEPIGGNLRWGSIPHLDLRYESRRNLPLNLKGFHLDLSNGLRFPSSPIGDRTRALRASTLSLRGPLRASTSGMTFGLTHHGDYGTVPWTSCPTLSKG